MKKALALEAATVCALGIMGGAFATEETLVEARYNVNEAYTVTFPVEIEFDGFNSDQTVTVEADDVLLNGINKLKIAMVSANGALKNGSSSITYTMANGENEPEDIVANTPLDILTIESGNRYDNIATLTFTSGDDSNVTLAGKHSDTLTFKVEVIFPFMQDIASLKSSFIEGEQYSLKDSRDGKVYSAAKIGSAIWMTKDLTYAPEGATWDKDGIYADEESGEVYYTWDAAQTVCPDGWKLPTNDDFESLFDGHDASWIEGAPFNGVRAGGAYDGVPNDEVGIAGRYWSSTTLFTNYIYYLSFFDDHVGLGTGFRMSDHSYPVRCVAK